MATIHIPQAEAECNLSQLLAQLDSDTSFVIENGSNPVAVLSMAPARARTFVERLALLPKDSDAVMDEDFAQDVQSAIDGQRAALVTAIFEE